MGYLEMESSNNEESQVSNLEQRVTLRMWMLITHNFYLEVWSFMWHLISHLVLCFAFATDEITTAPAGW